MNNKVIIINGAIGSGKSTLLKKANSYLSQKLARTVGLDLDDFYSVLFNDKNKQDDNLVSNWLIARKSISVLTDLYFENNIKIVFVVGLFFTNNEIQAFTNYIKSSFDLFIFTLKPDNNVIKRRILERGDNEKNMEWINNYLNYVESFYISNMNIIDNSDLTPEQTLDQIIKKINEY